MKNISVAIDIGSNTTRVIIAEFKKGEEIPNILSVAQNQTEGFRHGYVVNKEDAIKSLQKTIKEAEQNIDFKIKKAFVGISSITTKSETLPGFSIVSKADNEVTNLDIEKAIEDSQNNLNLNNKKNIYLSPVSYKLDGKDVLGRIEGSIGNKLEIKTLFVTCSLQHHEDIVEIFSELDIEVLNIIPNTIASSNICLSKKQKIVGTILVDIGATTTQIAIFENQNLIALHTFNIGSSDITNDIALGLKVSIEEAEKIKLGEIPVEISKRKVDEIIDARISDIFELIDNYLKKIKRNELLPGGIVFIGGGSEVEHLLEKAKNFLKLPVSIGQTELFGNTKTKLKNHTWFTALGLLYSTKDKYTEETGVNLFFKDLKNTIKSSLKQFMP